MIASGKSTADGFIEKFGYSPAGVWSAPGRVNLIGEHTDYNEGFVLPFAIANRTFAAVSKRDDGVIRVASSFTGESIELPVDQISKETAGGWVGYVMGVAWAFGKAGNAVPGFDVFIDSNVPVGAGLSSSAALECSVALAINDLLEFSKSKSELAQIGKLAENEIVGAPTGIMDQTASLNGEVDQAVFIDCRSLEIELVPLRFAENNLELVVIDTTVSHRLVDGGYAERRASCELGAKTLGARSLRELSVTDLPRAKELLEDRVYRRVKHVVTENQRVLDTVAELQTSGPLNIGQLLLASHASMRDDFEISIPELDFAVESAMQNGAIGARMTGGGFGGAAIALIEKSKVQKLTEETTSGFSSQGFSKPNIFVVQADAGAKREI